MNMLLLNVQMSFTRLDYLLKRNLQNPPLRLSMAGEGAVVMRFGETRFAMNPDIYETIDQQVLLLHLEFLALQRGELLH